MLRIALSLLVVARRAASLADHLLPRIWLGDAAPSPAPGGRYALTEPQRHHLTRVLRLKPGSDVRAFGRAAGEWVCELEGGGDVVASRQTRPPLAEQKRLELYFAPLRKKRTSLMIEKATELGVTALHPVRTARTEKAALSALKSGAHPAAVEAAAQCERLDVPLVGAVRSLDALDADLPLFICVERSDAPRLLDAAAGCTGAALLVGPEGGLAPEDLEAIARSRPDAVHVSLGDAVLRAETAAWAALTLAGAAIR